MDVVDGYNAIRRTKRLREFEARDGLEAGRKALLSAIVASGILGSRRVTVVFDGSGEIVPSAPSPHPRLVVRYSNPPADADTTILALLKRTRAKQNVTVVTADSELSWQARRLGATTIPPERWAPLQAPRRKPRSAEKDSGEKPSPSSSEVAYWLEVFGDGASARD